MQEQGAEIKAQAERIARLEAENKTITDRLQLLESRLTMNISITSTSAYLDQNIPNPVTGITTIRYQVPETTSSARLIITNAKGQVVKNIELK